VPVLGKMDLCLATDHEHFMLKLCNYRYKYEEFQHLYFSSLSRISSIAVQVS